MRYSYNRGVDFRPTEGKYPTYEYMRRPKEQTHITESYVSSPPALIVVDTNGDVFTLGNKMVLGPRGEFAFNILKNGDETGEMGSRIERRGGKIRVFTASGWKRWTGNTFI